MFVSQLYLYILYFTYRYGCLDKLITHINENDGGLEKFSRGYQSHGLLIDDKGLVCHEWVPAAEAVYLYGDFSEYCIF